MNINELGLDIDSIKYALSATEVEISFQTDTRQYYQYTIFGIEDKTYSMSCVANENSEILYIFFKEKYSEIELWIKHIQDSESLFKTINNFIKFMCEK